MSTSVDKKPFDDLTTLPNGTEIYVINGNYKAVIVKDGDVPYMYTYGTCRLRRVNGNERLWVDIIGHCDVPSVKQIHYAEDIADELKLNLKKVPFTKKCYYDFINKHYLEARDSQSRNDFCILSPSYRRACVDFFDIWKWS